MATFLSTKTAYNRLSTMEAHCGEQCIRRKLYSSSLRVKMECEFGSIYNLNVELALSSEDYVLQNSSFPSRFKN